MTKVLISLVSLVMLAGCGGTSTGGSTSSASDEVVQQKTNDFQFLKQQGVDIQSLTDVKRIDDLAGCEGTILTREQCDKLTRPLGYGFAEDMGDTHLLAVRDIDGEHTLVFYRINNGAGHSGAMVTYDAEGKICDGAFFAYCHNLWPVNPETLEGNLFRELVPVIEFNGKKHLRVSYTFQEMVMDPSTHVKSAPQWTVKWHQDYDISNDGIFELKEQKEDAREGNKSAIDELVYHNMRLGSYDAISRNDPKVMDQVNQMIPEWKTWYGKDDTFIDSHINTLFDANPKRFLQWMADNRDHNNMLPYFKKGEAWYRPSVEEQLGALDEDDQQYIRSIIKGWVQ